MVGCSASWQRGALVGSCTHVLIGSRTTVGSADEVSCNGPQRLLRNHARADLLPSLLPWHRRGSGRRRRRRTGRRRGNSTPDTSVGERLRDLTRDTARAKRPRAAAVGEVTGDEVADCIQREWAAARALDAERDATTGRGVDGRVRGAVGRRDAGGAGTKRPAATDEGGLRPAAKK